MDESRIVYPSRVLSQYIKYYWIQKRSNNGCFHLQTIPSGCLHLVFHRVGSIDIVGTGKQPGCFIRGQFSKNGILLSSGEMDMIAILFQPLGMFPFFSFRMEDITDNYVDVDDIEDLELSHLKNEIISEEDSMRCISLIESFLISRLLKRNDNMEYDRLSPSIGSIISNNNVTLDELASQSCYSYRQYKRLFTAMTGVNPKTYSRIIRFQHALYVLQRDRDIKLDELAFECGYYDISHLVKEFREFSGYTPSQYLCNHNPYSTFFANSSELNIVKEKI